MNVDGRQFILLAREERTPEVIGLGAAIDIAAHQDEEQHDLQNGEDFDDEDKPDPIEVGAVIGIGKNRFRQAPDHVTQCHRGNECAGDRPRPASLARPVERADQKERDDHKGRRQR
jgi:hypothetical protein